MIRKLLIIILLCFALPHNALCIKGTWRSYPLVDKVNDVAVDGDFVWCASPGGVVRWNTRINGHKVFTELGELSGPNCFGIEIDSDGGIWAIAANGVAALRNSAWQSWSTTEINGVETSALTSIAIDSGGNIWVGSNAGLSRFDGESWETFRVEDGLPQTFVIDIEASSNGRVWMLTRTMPSGYKATGKAKLPDPDTAALDDDSSAKSTGDPHYQATLSYYYNGKWIVERKYDEYYGNFPLSLAVGPGNKAVAGFPDDGLLYSDGVSWEYLKSNDGSVPTNVVRDVYFDTDGRLWYMSPDKLFRRDGESWTTFTIDDSIPVPGILAIEMVSDNNFWLGTNSGLVHYDKGVVTSLANGGKGSGYLHAMVEESNGMKWFIFNDSSSLTVSSFDGRIWKNHALDGVKVNSIAVDHTDRIWVTSQDGVYCHDKGVWTHYTMADGLPFTEIRSILIDSSNTVWVGSEGGLSYYDGSLWRTYTTDDGLPYNYIAAIREAPDGKLWVITYHDDDFTRFDGQIFSLLVAPPESRPGNYARYSFAPNGDLWMIYNRGRLSRYDGSEWTVFTNSDGDPNKPYGWAFGSDESVYAWNRSVISRWRDGAWTPWKVDGGYPFDIGGVKLDNKNKVYVLTNDGLYYTDCVTWTKEISLEDFPEPGFRSFTTDNNGRFWFDTWGNSLHCFVPESVSVDEEAPRPSALVSMSNHPNPFNPVTTIRITLADSGPTEIILYSLTGQTVRRLMSKNLSAGVHDIMWDGRNDSGMTVSSGIYLAKAVSGGREAFHRMLLLR